MFKKMITSIALSAAVMTATVVTPALVAPQTAEASFSAPLFKQYDAAWGTDLMGGGDTMTKSGCAVSSVAMALRHKSITVSGSAADPGKLNTWLKSNAGYSGNSIVWGSVTKLSSRISFDGRYTSGTSLSAATLRTYLDGGNKAIIANVRSGGHWVLLTDHNGGTVFNVNDPGYSQSTYNYSDIVGYAVYTIN
ncbi:peptidase C39-like protein [Tumebacillus sp. BK434]|uniref:C39 family peptidase n=1 Tax=Tumebacillus sp. BK434 TaxID=2512169 RepID=UPI0010D5FC08|nr:C39 family peptidase [Tumebacillus sp. BK434]TCP55412.1 peptidase C39-like protein [Tumebacillus sp. BK434]